MTLLSDKHYKALKKEQNRLMNKQMKTKTYKPKTIKEAIDLLQIFLECDLWSHFNPTIIDGKKWYREDAIGSEKELKEYLNYHFDILRKQIKSLSECK